MAGTEAAISEEQLPAVHLFPHPPGALGAQALLEHLIVASDTVAAAVGASLPLEFESREHLVIEGAWLHPRWVRTLQIPSLEVCSVYIHEPDAAEVLAAMRSRSTRPGPTPSQLVVAEAAWMHGNWLREEAEAQGLPTVAARPRETLVDRVGHTLGL